ncbi:hypothetical protein K501DRAFT_288457, partial [Backusella circina FSU 941]
MNNYTSSVTCHQNKPVQNTIFSGDDSEQTYIASETATFPDSLLPGYDHLNTSTPINIPQSQNSSSNISMSNKNFNDLVYKSLSSTDSDSSYSLDSFLIGSFENFGSSTPNNDLAACFDMLGVNSPARSNMECLSPDTVQSAEYSVISSPPPLFHLGSPASQETTAAAAAQFFTNTSLNNMADSLQSNSTDDHSMQLKLELAEMLPQQDESNNNYINDLFDCLSASPYFSSNNNQMVPENNDGEFLSSNKFEAMDFPDIKLFSQPPSPLPENELTVRGGTVPEYYYCSNPPQTPQNLASDPLINFGSFFTTTT